MIAIENPAPLRQIRLNRKEGANNYRLKERLAQLCKEYSVKLVKFESESESSWTEIKDARRCELIDKSLHTRLTTEEKQELLDLQQQAEKHFDEVSPPPIAGALKLHQELMALKKE